MGVDMTIERLGEEVPGFESNSRGGARAFDEHINWGDNDPTGCSGNGITISGVRPKDFALARQWVDTHYPAENTAHAPLRQWFLDALSLMEKDDAVYIFFSR